MNLTNIRHNQAAPAYSNISTLTQQILADMGGYVSGKKYLSFTGVTRMLERMGYEQKRAAELVHYFHECVESAYERGVFVVSSRFIRMDDFDSDNATDLLMHFQTNEPDYFDPMRWYRFGDFERELKSQSYCYDIIRELTPYILRHVRAAFLKGIKGAASNLIH